MINDLKTDIKQAEADEKTSQKEYENLMAESSASRAMDAKSITDKEASRAGLERRLMGVQDAERSSTRELAVIQQTIAALHQKCDFIMENYDMRKEARSAETESLKNSKAVLKGASFGF